MPVLLAHAGTPDELTATLLFFGAVWTAWIAWSRLRQKGFPRLPRTAAWVLLPLAAGLLAAGIFLPGALVAPPIPAPPAGVRIASTASLSFQKPSPGQLAGDSPMEVVMDLQGGTIAEATTTRLTPDTGHIHLTLDGTLVSMTYGTVQPIDVSGLPPGRHELQAEYVAADHAPFDPRVIVETTFRTGGDV